MRFSFHSGRVSEVLRELAETTPEGGYTVEDLLERLGPRGLLTVVILMTLPFLIPVSIPGASIPFGIVIVLICAALMTSRPLRLPKRLGALRIPRDRMMFWTKQAAKLFRRLESLTKPRLIGLTRGRTFVSVHLAGTIANAVLLMLPLPLPLSNTIPAYGILFFALGLLRRDGVMVVGGYAMLSVALAYLAATSVLGVLGVKALIGL